MRQYERNGVHVDQCENCRGIFLDMGELEAIVRAATPEPGSPQAQGQAPQPQTFNQQPQAYPQQQPYQQGYAQQPYQAPYDPRWGRPQKRRGGIAGLFFSS